MSDVKNPAGRAALRAVCEAATDYEVRDDGTVWSRTGWRGHGLRQLSAYPDQHGYLKVRLTLAGRRKVAVHRLVCEAFHGPRPTERHEVRHKNGVKTDNRADNLCWGTPAENAADRDAHGRTASGPRNGFAKFTAEQVAFIRRTVADGATRKQMAEVFGVNRTTIERIVRRESYP